MTCCDFEFMEILETLDIQKKKDERDEQACKLLIYLTPKKLGQVKSILVDPPAWSHESN